MTDLEITTSTAGGVCRLTLEGEATIYNAAEFKEYLVAELERSQELELNLSRIREIDTAGVQLLVLLCRESRRLGKKFRAVQPSQSVQTLVDLYGLGSYLNSATSASVGVGRA